MHPNSLLSLLTTHLIFNIIGYTSFYSLIEPLLLIHYPPNPF